VTVVLSTFLKKVIDYGAMSRNWKLVGEPKTRGQPFNRTTNISYRSPRSVGIYVVSFVSLHVLTLLVFVPVILTWSALPRLFGGRVLLAASIPIVTTDCRSQEFFKCRELVRTMLVTWRLLRRPRAAASGLAWASSNTMFFRHEPEIPHTPRARFLVRMSMGCV